MSWSSDAALPALISEAEIRTRDSRTAGHKTRASQAAEKVGGSGEVSLERPSGARAIPVMVYQSTSWVSKRRCGRGRPHDSRTGVQRYKNRRRFGRGLRYNNAGIASKPSIYFQQFAAPFDSAQGRLLKPCTFKAWQPTLREAAVRRGAPMGLAKSVRGLGWCRACHTGFSAWGRR
jgi:hypothetical protein